MSASARLDTAALDEFDGRGFVVIRDALGEDLRSRLRQSAEILLASKKTQGRDRGADGKDGFRGCVALDEAFLRLLANPRVLPTVVALLSPNVHLLSSHLIALPSIPTQGQRSIRTPQRPGWHRDMYGVAGDLGHKATPRMAIKCAYYVSDTTPDCGITSSSPEATVSPSRQASPPEPSTRPVPSPPTWGPMTRSCSKPHLARRRAQQQRTTTTGSNDAIRLPLARRCDDPAPELLDYPELTDVERQLLGQPDRNSDGSLAKGAGAAPLHRWWSNTSDIAASLAAN